MLFDGLSALFCDVHKRVCFILFNEKLKKLELQCLDINVHMQCEVNYL